MAMLAERKRKQRWTLNPRGKLWTEDTNNFGQKMLRRMGWKSGKGLGANENGATEPLRISYKNDSQGMGYKETEQWTAHDDNFASLLESLNGNKDDADNNIIKVNSLQSKGQNCKTRINYHKFTKAKDLSRYTEKDLASIFGKKTLKQKNVEEETNKADEKITKTDSSLEKENDNLVYKGSMVDYFKKKLPNFGRQNSEYVIGNNGVLARERSDSESEVRFGFGFGFSMKNNEQSEDINEEKSIKKKKRKYTETFISYVGKDTENLEETHIVQKKKSKKNKSNSDSMQGGNEEVIGDNILKNYADSFVSANNNKNNGKVDNVSYILEGDNKNTRAGKVKDRQDLEGENILKQKKKKAKNKLKENNLDNCNSCENSFQNINSEGNGENYEEVFNDDICKSKKTKKSKCKNKDKISEENSADNSEKGSLNEDIVCNGLSKNKLKDISLEHIVSIDAVENVFEDKKKKVKKDQNGIRNVNDQDNSEEISCKVVTMISDKKSKKHKKKKKEKDEDSSVTCNINENNEISHNYEGNIDNFEESLYRKERKTSFKSYINGDEDNADYVVKMKKKKLKNSELKNTEMKEDITKTSNESVSQNGDNKYGNENIEEYSNEEVLNITKKKKKSKKNKTEDCGDSGISNPAFNDVNNTISNEESSSQDNTNLSEDTPKIKKKKRKHEKELSNAGIDNPIFKENLDNSDLTSNVEKSNPYEVKVKKRKTSDENLDKVGLDNPALNLSDPIPDTDLMLNIVNTPTILLNNQKEIDWKPSKERRNGPRRKSVRFSDVLQERIIPNDPSERSNEYLSNRNDLFDINSKVVEDSVKEEMKRQGIEYRNNPSVDLTSKDPKEISKRVVESSVKEELNRSLNSYGFINNGFDIRSVDKVNFYETRYEIKSPKKGIDNKAFNKVKNHIEENVESISNKIERYQAEVENNINEAKVNENVQGLNYMVGDVGTQINRSIQVEDGVKLCFKEMRFRTNVPTYLRSNVSAPKKSYRHLIRGDVTVTFKKSNLHDIPGYAVK